MTDAPPTNYTIRELRESDLPALVDFYAVLHAAESFVTPRGLAYLTTWFNQPRDFWLIPVAFTSNPDGSEGAIIGTTGVAHSGEDEASWGGLSVLPEYRAEIAPILYDRAEVIALEQRLTNLTFNPKQQNLWLQDFLRERGYEFSRYFWTLRLAPATSLPAVQLPAGYTLRTFIRGQDEQLWQQTDAAVFAGGFGQHVLSLEEIEQMLDDPTRRTDGFFFAEKDGVTAGYCETLVFANEEDATQPGDGLIANLGVLPEHRGNGLGRALLLTGVNYLRPHCTNIDLHVDGENANALRLYESVGFAQHEGDVVFVKTFKYEKETNP